MLLPLRVGVVPGRPKARVRCPVSADTAHAPKKIIRAMTTASTSENVSGTGMRFEVVNLFLVSLGRFPQRTIHLV